MNGARRTRAWPWALLAVGVLLVGLAGRSSSREGDPLDPRGTDPLGARALVLLLEHFGADVDITGAIPSPGSGGVALVLVDRLNREQEARLTEWVESGGTLVVTDPLSSFSPALARGGSLFDPTERPSVLQPRCDLPAVRAAQRLDDPGAAAFRLREGEVGCYPVGRGFALVARSQGRGVVVGVGGAGPFVNAQIDEADNAALAVGLLAPRPGGHVTIVEEAAPGLGRRTLTSLVSPRVKNGLWQLVVAFVVFALWRARRLGRPVLEPQPVDIAGSELVLAVGNLLQQAHRRPEAAAMLRLQLRHTLCERLGIPFDTPAQVVAEAAAARAGVDADAVTAVLTSGSPASDTALVELARTIESLRSEVTHVR